MVLVSDKLESPFYSIPALVKQYSITLTIAATVTEVSGRQPDSLWLSLTSLAKECFNKTDWGHPQRSRFVVAGLSRVFYFLNDRAAYDADQEDIQRCETRATLR